MKYLTSRSSRSANGAVERAREARRTVGRERQYHCGGCGYERRSWVALHSCPSCGSSTVATVVRTALA